MSDDGLSFMAMEYFPGQPITGYADKAGLSQRQRVSLFVEVCEAVEYAHRNLIVHRDLKPSNILVNQSGEAKLLDFGIARLLVDDAEMAALTATGSLFFTPDYASPEQIDGSPVTTATDVYSLGAVLYELLTGGRPHRFAALTPREIVDVVCHQPVPPSALGNDLDPILGKALRKDPRERYESPRTLAADLTNWLSAKPVVARPETASYRLKLFVKRHRIPVLAAAMAVLSLCAGTGVALWQAQVARRESAEATRRFGQVRSLARTVLFDFDAKIRDLAGATEARELLASTALEYLDGLRADRMNEPSLQREVAEAYERVGDVLGEPARPNLGKRAEAIASYQKAKAIRDALPAEALEDQLAMARLCLKLYAVAGGKELAEASVAATRAALGRNHVNPEVFALAMRAENALGTYYRNRSNGHGAIRHFDAALRIGQEWRAKNGSAQVEEAIAGSLALKARAALLTGESRITLDAANAMLAIEEKLLAGAPRNPAYRRQLFKAHLLKGYALGHPDYFHLGRPQEAAVVFRHAIALAESHVAADRNDALAKGDLGDAYWALAVTIAEESPGEAKRLLEASLAESTDLMKGSPNTLAFIHNVASTHAALAVPLRAMGRSGEAASHLREAVRLQTVVADARPKQIGLRHNLIDTLVLLADIELDRRMQSASWEALDAALKIASTVERDEGYLSKLPGIAKLHRTVGRHYAERRDPRAVSWLEKALANWEELAEGGIATAVVEPHKRELLAELSAYRADAVRLASRATE
ncbi:MAG: serine/threonine-protein kinase [Bryobacterales bacterium]|nr:serine/threonine-protein kinase [Bryobacterales bacterium]